MIISAKELLLRARQFADDDSRKSAEILFEIRRNFSDTPEAYKAKKILAELDGDPDFHAWREAEEKSLNEEMRPQCDSFESSRFSLRVAPWTPPDNCTGLRNEFLFYACIVLVSLVAFLVSSLPLLGDGVYGYTLMLYFFVIGVGGLFVLHVIVAGKSEYWGKVFIAASTLLPVWWFTLMDPFSKFVYRFTHH